MVRNIKGNGETEEQMKWGSESNSPFIVSLGLTAKDAKERQESLRFSATFAVCLFDVCSI